MYKLKNNEDQKQDLFLLEELIASCNQDEYFDSFVLLNKLGITNYEDLSIAENEIMNKKMQTIFKDIKFEKFNSDLLKQIHNYLFNDFYYFAGYLRTVNLKSDSLCSYLPHTEIETTLNKLFIRLESENLLKGLGRETLIKKLSVYMAGFEKIHPFTAGNEACKRIFFAGLAKDAGYALDFSKCKDAEWEAANEIANDYQDKTYLKLLLEKAVTKSEKLKEKN